MIYLILGMIVKMLEKQLLIYTFLMFLFMSNIKKEMEFRKKH